MKNKEPAFTKELFLILSIVAIILCCIFSSVNILFCALIGILFFVLSAHGLANRNRSKFHWLIFTLFSPYALMETYLWLIIALRNHHANTWKLQLLIFIILDILYFRTTSEKACSSNTIVSDNVSYPKTELANTESHWDTNLKEVDTYFEDAGRFIIKEEKASIGMLQRMFKIGFNRAARIMDQLCDAGVVGPEEYTKPRKILMTPEEFHIFLETHGLLRETPAVPQNSSNQVSACNNKFDYMNGYEFESYCAQLLRNNGYSSVKITQGSNDNGIDVLAEKEGIKYGIQCKCYSSDIGVSAIQEAFSGAKFYNCHVPVVLTNRYFTRQAQELATKINVLLWDRAILIKMVDKVEK